VRVVIDSNVWVSALVFGGAPRQAFERMVSGGNVLVVSEELLTEVRRIIHQKFPDFSTDYADLLVALRPLTATVQLGSLHVTASRDADDDKIIETALIGAAHYIVTGDNDLLVLEKYEDVAMVTVADFLSL